MSAYGRGYWSNDGKYITTSDTTGQSETVNTPVEAGGTGDTSILDIVASGGNVNKQKGLLDIIQNDAGGIWKSNSSLKDMTEADFESMLRYALENMADDDQGYEIPMMRSSAEGLRFEDF